MSTTESAPETPGAGGAKGSQPASSQGSTAAPQGGGRSVGSRADSLAVAAYSWAREAFIVVVLALGLSLIVKTWLLQAFYIPSASMENTLLAGDRVVVSKLTPGPFDLQRGDVVVFADPDHWLAPVPTQQRGVLGRAGHDILTFVGLLPNDEGNHLIKRIVGLPGDHVVCCTRAGLLTVNGRAVTEEYIKPGDAPSELKFSITVPAGKLWVMGDNRSDSGDSRYHDDGTGRTGSVAESLVVGRAMTVVWPLHDVAWLGRGGSTFADVPAHPAVAARKSAVGPTSAKARAGSARKPASASTTKAATKSTRSSG